MNKTIEEILEELNKAGQINRFLMEQTEGFEEVTCLSLICILIDEISGRYGRDSKEIAETICKMVTDVNNELGPM